jgi:hypothetical protein
MHGARATFDFDPNLQRAGDRTRTGDVQLGKLAFYQLNYARKDSPIMMPESHR